MGGGLGVLPIRQSPNYKCLFFITISIMAYCIQFCKNVIDINPILITFGVSFFMQKLQVLTTVLRLDRHCLCTF